jgi:hypothetical protein
LGKDLSDYLSNGWLRDRVGGCPYGQSERRMLQYEIYAATTPRDPPTGWVQLLAIITGEV